MATSKNAGTAQGDDVFVRRVSDFFERWPGWLPGVLAVGVSSATAYGATAAVVLGWRADPWVTGAVLGALVVMCVLALKELSHPTMRPGPLRTSVHVVGGTVAVRSVSALWVYPLFPPR